ncbi:unnamed protein product [Notodromas monacha]|uniref:Neuferricin n=1 Tax=Notodromas monacha TaxID=399045 RepID=A0A7R9GBN8_9CRUS|nr:unnamed protein product [Notodromas monacha]CAG0915187.1 unnamed protein product [Notodromas monacha]
MGIHARRQIKYYSSHGNYEKGRGGFVANCYFPSSYRVLVTSDLDFSCRDATRAFVTGDFSPEGLIDDVDGLSDADLRGLDEWSKFYDREYSYVGKLSGRYYDAKGRPTAYQKQFTKNLRKAFQSKDAEESLRKIFPPCNSEWKQDSGGRVWCSERSGGVERSWAGVPRKFFEPGTGKFRCACVKNFGEPLFGGGGADDVGDLSNPNLMEYEGCAKDSVSCQLPKN